MQIKTNIRAGAGANSGGVNAKHSTDSTDSTVVVTPPPPVVYYPPVSRCVGI